MAAALALHDRQIEGQVYCDSGDEPDPDDCRGAVDLINRESGSYGANGGVLERELQDQGRRPCRRHQLHQQSGALRRRAGYPIDLRHPWERATQRDDPPLVGTEESSTVGWPLLWRRERRTAGRVKGCGLSPA
ncbi:hypothetical protein DL767_007542 [Monosporascus sp. MG133]|nr:hypothetical protein DL767_007542 [Monosporascus sp. MG133]